MDLQSPSPTLLTLVFTIYEVYPISRVKGNALLFRIRKEEFGAWNKSCEIDLAPTERGNLDRIILPKKEAEAEDDQEEDG